MEKTEMLISLLGKESDFLKEFLRALSAEGEAIISLSLEGIIKENNKKEEIINKLWLIDIEKNTLLSSFSEQDRAKQKGSEELQLLSEKIQEMVAETRATLEANLKLLSFYTGHIVPSLEKILAYINGG
jgi:hypothetical protein